MIVNDSLNIGVRLWAAFLIAATVTVGLTLTASADPRISLSPETFDFGYLPEGQTVFHRYWLSNRGDDTLVIQEVKPQCGCTTVPLITDRLAPTDSVPLDLSFDSKNIKGRVFKAVRIWSNDSTLYPAIIYFTADVADSVQKIVADPPVASLTTIDNPHQIIELTNRDDHAYQIGLAVPPPSFLNCEFARDSVHPGETITLMLTPGKGAPLGDYKTSITLKCDGNNSYPLTIPVKGIGFMQ